MSYYVDVVATRPTIYPLPKTSSTIQCDVKVAKNPDNPRV